MDTIYGDVINSWRCYINTWSTEDGWYLYAGLTVGIQNFNGHFEILEGIVGYANADGVDSQINTGFTTTGSFDTKDLTSASRRFAKRHDAYDVTLSGCVRNQSGYMNGTSSASRIITVPALEHHYVTFDANGGTGAPDRVVNWYGESVTIPTTKPTRANYEFLGWSETKNGQVTYTPGGEYWIDDADITYYAVWKLLYIPPKFTDGLAIRTNSMTSTTADYYGGYCYASFTYEVDTTIDPSNVAKSIVCRYYQDEGTTSVTLPTTGDHNKASGTVNAHFAVSNNSTYYVECLLTDTKDGTATIARSITSGVLPIEIANKGQSVGILSTAPKTAGLQLGGFGNPDFLIAANTTYSKLESIAQIHGSTSSTSQAELTLSTQGLDSSGNIARGNINLVADSLRFNSQPLPIKAWVLYERPIGDATTYSGNMNNWYTNDGLFKNVEGPDHSDYWTVDNSTYCIIPLRRGYWYIENVVGGVGSPYIIAGIFTKNGDEICTTTSVARTDMHVTAATHYLYRFTDSYNVGDVGWFLKANHSGYVALSRNQTYANIFYLGPA